MSPQDPEDGLARCPWATSHPLLLAYHDQEWGVPLRDDRALFEFLVLEGFQAGLSWLTILKRREAFRVAFDGFDPRVIAAYGPEKLAALLNDQSIIRNRLKIEASVANAKAMLAAVDKFGSFADYLWGLVDPRRGGHAWDSLKDLPAETPTSKAMSKDLKARGFKFIGSTTCYAMMQAAGLVNDHLTGCYRWSQLA